MTHAEISDSAGIFGTRTFEERTEAELRTSAQVAVLRELFMEEGVQRLMYLTIPLDDKEARDDAARRLHQAEALAAMGKLVTESDLRYTKEPDANNLQGLKFAVASFNQDRPEVLITYQAAKKIDWRQLKRTWQTTTVVSIGGQALEGKEAADFAYHALTVLERVKSKTEKLREGNTIRIPAPRTG